QYVATIDVEAGMLAKGTNQSRVTTQGHFNRTELTDRVARPGHARSRKIMCPPCFIHDDLYDCRIKYIARIVDWFPGSYDSCGITFGQSSDCALNRFGRNQRFIALN